MGRLEGSRPRAIDEAAACAKFLQLTHNWEKSVACSLACSSLPNAPRPRTPPPPTHPCTQAVHFAREGADVAILYLPQEEKVGFMRAIWQH